MISGLFKLCLLTLLFSLNPSALSNPGSDPVKNGLEIAGKGLELHLRETLRINGPQEKRWHGAFAAIDADPLGNIYITDPGSERVLQYAPDGTFLKEIGGHGHFFNLLSFQWLADQSAVAVENAQAPCRLSFYDRTLKQVNQIRMTDAHMRLQWAQYSPEGAMIYGLFFRIDPKENSRALVSAIMDANFKVKYTVMDRPIPRGDTTLPMEEFWANELARHLVATSAGLGLVAFGHEGQIYTASTQTYTIKRLDQNLRETLVFEKAHTPYTPSDADHAAAMATISGVSHAIISSHHQKFVTDEVVGRAYALAKLKKMAPPIRALIPIPGGLLLVVHRSNHDTGKTRFHLFDNSGRYVGDLDLKGLPYNPYWPNPQRLVFKENQAYALHQDPKGNLHAVRYQYTLKDRP